MRKALILIALSLVWPYHSSPVHAQQNCRYFGNRADAITNMAIPAVNHSVFLHATTNKKPINSVTVSLDTYNCVVLESGDAAEGTKSWYQSLNKFRGEGRNRSLIWNRTDETITDEDGSIDAVMLIDESVKCSPALSGMGDCVESLPNNESAIIRGKQLSSDGDSLKIYLVEPYANKVISKVEYYIDGTFRYQTAALEPVDKKYLKELTPQKVDRIVSYLDGSQVTYSRVTEREDVGSLLDIFFSFGILNNTLIRNVLIGSFVFFFSVGLLSLLRHIYQVRKWRHDHIVGK